MEKAFPQNNKPVIVFDISSSHRGGPYIACKNISNSPLKHEFTFKEITYSTKLGRFISWRRIKDLKRQIKSLNPDGIIITGLQLSCFHVIVAALLAGVKTRIITIHGSSTEALSLSKLKKSLLYLIEFFSLWMCTSFYGVSKYASTLSAANLFKKKNRGYVYNLPTEKRHCHDTLRREDLGFNDTDIIIISSGRIVKEKGYEVLANAIQEINHPKIKFIILGDGDYLSQMKEKLSKEIADGRVNCPGFCENVYNYLNIADIFILPTLHETLSISLLEAAQAGLPLISCNVGGVPEVIENGVNGILVEPNDIKALAEAINTLAQNPIIRNTMGKHSSELIKTKFSQNKSINRLKDIIINDLKQ